MNSKKGFTLIELLAVIIILGILLLIAIPSVTSYINNSRKETYLDTAKQYIRGATNLVNSGALDIYDTGTTYYIPSTCIPLETGGGSPYGGDFSPAYVLVTYDNNSFNYYWMSRDNQSMGIKTPVMSGNIKIDNITAGVKSDDVSVKYGIDGRDTLVEFSSDCSSIKESKTATDYIDVNGDIVEAIFEVGEYITIVPDSASYTITSDMTGYRSNQTINPSELTLWIVIGVNSNGTVDAVSEYTSSNNIIFTGVTGYTYFVNSLKTIATQYANSRYTVGTRIVGYNGQTPIISNRSAYDGSIDVPLQTTSTPLIYDGVGEEFASGVLGDTLYVNDIKAIMNLYKSDKTTYGNYGLISYRPGSTTEKAGYWIASRRFNYYYDNFFAYTCRMVHTDSNIYEYRVREHDTGWRDYDMVGYGIRPIITIKAGVQIASGQGTKTDSYILK